MTAITDAYFLEVIARLGALRQTLAEPMEKAAAVICEAARTDHRVYIFGTGHSHMLAEEVHYRAGGLALTVPVLVGSAMLHEGAVISSVYERTEGLVRPVLERYRFYRAVSVGDRDKIGPVRLLGAWLAPPVAYSSAPPGGCDSPRMKRRESRFVRASKSSPPT